MTTEHTSRRSEEHEHVMLLQNTTSLANKMIGKIQGN
jgi:hypothetical protein